MQTIRLRYSGHGKGENAIIFFHGFGQDRSAFESYIPELAAHFRLYFVDLPCHGQTPFLTERLKHQGWNELLNEFLESEKISRFSIVSFSLGGRFSLACLPHLGHRIDKLCLLAPDGIYQSPWYALATSKLGNGLFKYLMTNEKAFDVCLRLLEKMGLASHALVRFARKQLPTPEDKKRLYSTWTYMRSLGFNKHQLKRHIENADIDIHLFLGDQDLIIPTEQIKARLDLLDNIKWHSVKARHDQMIDVSLLPVSRLLKGG